MKRLFALTFLILGMATWAFAQTAVLVRDSQPVSAFYGAAALTNAVNAAEPTGDIIVLSGGTFNNPGEIKKSVSIYGQGHEGANRTYIQGKLSLRPSEEGSIDNIHLEGLYLENHFNILNDGNRSPISNLTVVKCHVTGMFLYMPSNNVTLRNCIIMGDMKTYPNAYTATNMLIENCWKDGGSFNIFTAESTITVRNSIFNCRSISGFDNSSAFCKATFENSIIAGATLAAGSSATNCVLLSVNTSANDVTTTNCWAASSVSEAFTNAESLVYEEGAIPAVKAEYVGTDNTPVGITGGNYPWSVVPSQPTVNFETTLVKDADGFYKIGSLADWKELKRVVENLDPIANAKMTADIDLGDDQTMIGYYEETNKIYKPFCGIFDGKGHTLTINYDRTGLPYSQSSVTGAAPFHYIQNATIKNLHVAGTITTSTKFAGGIVVDVSGTNSLIEHCRSSVNIISTVNGEGCMGGLISHMTNNCSVSVRDCVFDGSMNAPNAWGNGGIMGYKNGTGTFENCLSAPSELSSNAYNSFCIVRQGGGTLTVSNCHYKMDLGTMQGNQATDEELANGRTAFYLQAGREEMFWGQKIGTDPLPVLTSDESKRVYRSAEGYTNNPALAIADQSLVPLLYTRNSDNELTITGFDPGFTPPDDYALVIPDDIDGSPVVAIGNSAFRSNANISSVTANSVTKVGEYAFEKNTSLVSITMNEVLTLQRAAFDMCTSLTTINMPKVETIADIVFGTATSLTEVSLPKAKTLGVEAFGTCANLRRVSLPEATTLGNGVFLKGYALTHTGEDGIYIPNVTTIGTYLFRSCTALTTVSMPKVTAIGTYTFDGCTALASVDLPLITAVPERAFQNCSALPAFDHPAVTSIGHYAFVNCSSLTAFSSSTVTALGNNVFEGCTKLESASFPNVTSMGTGVFHQCAALDFDQVTLSKMTSLPNYTFQSCTGITSVTLPNDRMPLVTSIGAYAFRYDTGITSVTINTAMTLGGSAFSDCSNNESVSAPLVTAIPEYAFNKNTKLTTLNLPEVLTIGRNAFDYCTSLPTLSLPKVQSIGDYAFGTNTSLTEVSLPLCTTLATEVFGTCTSLTKAYLPEVTTMGIRMFYKNTSLQTLGEDAIYLPKITTIPEGTFRECTNMLTAPLQSSITSIGNNAFYQNTNLQNVTIPATVTFIGNSAFRYCEKLNNVVLPGSLTSIQDWAFANCTSLENLTLEEGITSINRDVFQYSGMKKVVLPATLGTIGVNLFHQCNQLEVLDLSKCVNVYDLYNMTTVQRTGGSGQYNIFFGVPATTKVIMPAYAKVEPADNVVVDNESFNLAQDEEGYYLINNAEAWDKFVVYSRANPTINGSLTADIDLTGHEGKLGVGNGESAYFTWQGTLDGQGHYLTIKYKTNKEFVGGVFAYTENATIKNLRVRGSVDVIHRVVGGFVGFVKDNLTIQDCESDIAFTVTPSTANMHITGFVGQGKVGNISFTDCLFKGSIVGNSSFRYAAGFMGWMESAGRVSYNNCLNIGDVSNVETNYNYPLGATQSSGQSTAVACYHTTGNSVTNNESLSKAATIEELASGKITHRLQGGRERQHWGQKIGTDPMPRLTDEAGTRVYRGDVYTNEPVEENELAQDADGYYLVGTPAEWRRFAELVSEEDMTNMNVRMTDDINLGLDQTMIGGGQAANDYGGTGSIKYQGIFDGQGHTLKINYIATNAHTAPFRYIQNATIKNLHVEGSITTAYGCAGGIVGICYGQQIHSYIENCVSSVHIYSSYYNTGGFYSGASHGGIAANLNYYGQLHITDCVFDGSIQGENRDVVWGGMMGIPDGTVTLTNCLQVGKFICNGVIGGSNGSGTFSCVFGNGYASRVNVNNSYYLNQLGNAQGTQATEATLADGSVTAVLQAGREEEIWTQNPYTNQPMLRLFCEDYNPDGIISPIGETGEGAAIYNLAGQKIVNGKLSRGIFIVNGRKVLIR